MNPKSKANPVGNFKVFCQRSFGMIGGIGFLSMSLFNAPVTATEELVIPTDPAPSQSFVDPTPAAPAPSVQTPTVPRSKIRTAVTRPIRSSYRRRNANRTAVAKPRVKLAAPKISISNSAPVSSPVDTQPASIRSALQGKNSYIDPTNYSVGQSNRTNSTPSVVLSERSTGCRTVVQGGSLNRGCGSVSATRRQRSGEVTAARAYPPRYQRLAARTKVSAQHFVTRAPRVSPLRQIALQPITAPSHSPRRYRNVSYPLPSANKTASNSRVGLPPSSNQIFSIEPIIRRGISLALAPMPEYSRATTLYAPTAPDIRQGNTDLLFPLPTAVPITSAFGWRIHPVTGRGRMHQGTDLGAPTGTPVLASYSGEVAIADWMGGYGLTVVLRHLEGTQESRYAHLSEIFVKPGQSVEKGEVIGRVGSTGLSTGPHLHFEWRHLTNKGWVAVDAGTHLEYAMESLIQSRQLAAAGGQPQG
ncbi:MAG: peptidoglycan DD-metalloendopeptidase family protein [Snowella sp.]|nr:peptidoglycan DD-metalloendopeptidase family protein [Snowella sp.]